MQKEAFIQMATRVAEATATDSEKELFLYHVNTFVHDNPLWEELSAETKQNIREEVRLSIRKEIYPNAPAKPKTTKLWPGIAAVAAAAALLVLGVYFFNAPGPIVNRKATTINQSDIAPGKNGATLTLANGKKIKLSDVDRGELAREANVTITKTADGQLVYEVKSSGFTQTKEKTNILSTAKGETYQIKLPDGSLVYLNAASSLTYNAALIESGKRMVKLNGEAYFEIAKDRSHPFIVKTETQEVTVLGTHFNINSYADEPAVKTTLLEGAIKISGSGAIRQLHPGQQAVQTPKGIEIVAADEEEAMAWRNGKIVFHNEPLTSIMRKIARWYDVQIVYGPGVEEVSFMGSVSRTANISEVLQFFERTENIRFTVEGRTVTVSARQK